MTEEELNKLMGVMRGLKNEHFVPYGISVGDVRKLIQTVQQLQTGKEKPHNNFLGINADIQRWARDTSATGKVNDYKTGGGKNQKGARY